LFVVLVEFDDIQQQIVGFRALPGPRGHHPHGQQLVDISSSWQF
jgi:hypothetical protein